MQSVSKSIYRGKLLSSLPAVGEIHKEIAVSEETVTWISLQREIIANILLGKDPRLLVIVGPCSIHDVQAAVEYAKRLSVLQNKYLSQMYIVMRTYFEKPRTRKGWKGIMHDPDLNGSYNVEKGHTICSPVFVLNHNNACRNRYRIPRSFPYSLYC